MPDLTTTTVTVSGMTCGHCVAAVTEELTRLAVFRETGVRSRLMLDISGFRAQKRSQLEDLAADTVRRGRGWWSRYADTVAGLQAHRVGRKVRQHGRTLAELDVPDGGDAGAEHGGVRRLQRVARRGGAAGREDGRARAGHVHGPAAAA